MTDGRNSPIRPLAARVVTALVLGGAATAGIVLLPTAAVAVLLGAFVLAGSREWARFAKCGPRARGVYVVALALLMFATFPRAALLVDAVLVVALAGWLVAAYGLAVWPRPLPAAAIAAVGIAALLPGWLLLTHIHGAGPRGPWLAFTGLALVAAADIGAFFVGRAIGRTKLAPGISPGKTWEGVGGGIGLAAVAALLASHALAVPVPAILAIAVAMAAASVIGDLTVSMLKRNVGAKDSGGLLPGHGGVMDRIDGMTTAIPVYALGLEIFGLLG